MAEVDLAEVDLAEVALAEGGLAEVDLAPLEEVLDLGLDGSRSWAPNSQLGALVLDPVLRRVTSLWGQRENKLA